MGHSPAEMGHSPAEMESDKQEKYNLLHDNPIAKHASGGSWMSKHSNSALNFNAPKHKHKHPKGDDRAYKGHTGNAPTSSNTSKKDLARMGSKGPQMGHSPAEMGHDSPAKNLGHGMDEMSAEKGAHRKYHLKQRMSKKSKDSINK